MRLTERADGSATITYGEEGGRVCGTCTLCCKLLPVPTLGKTAGERCQHQRAAKGCTIYPHRPGACRTWACRWLCDEAAAGLPRPDACHYVVDMLYDRVTQGAHDFPVLQVWVDPAFRDAHEDPRLRAYLQMMGEKYGVAALIRYNSRDAFVLLPPCLTDDGRWYSVSGTMR